MWYELTAEAEIYTRGEIKKDIGGVIWIHMRKTETDGAKKPNRLNGNDRARINGLRLGRPLKNIQNISKNNGKNHVYWYGENTEKEKRYQKSRRRPTLLTNLYLGGNNGKMK